MDTSFNMFIETEVPKNEIIISRTDLNGIITYANETFARISGYSSDELVGKPHNILRHPDMPSSVFYDMWKTLKDGGIWRGYIKNIRKDRGYYWVYAEISGVYKNGRLIEYKSMRSYVEREKRIQMQKLYDQMRKNERDPVRVVSYLPYPVYYDLLKKSEAAGVSPQKWLEKLIKDAKKPNF
ncbi:PAS domain-containing protein [Nitrosophilus alvini]|uniref:PAS domain-containing protein n=1 Tax=Nitrosophilus alvini TaxID=2714855 RepID=UPI00190E0907|nr:PAS domain-containing protein [Nitrosophilus alvini]